MRATKHHDIDTALRQSLDEMRTRSFFPSHKISNVPSARSYSTILRFLRSAVTRGSIAICADVVAMTSRHLSKLNVSSLITVSALKGSAIRQTIPTLQHVAERCHKFGIADYLSCQNNQKLYDDFLTKSQCDLHLKTRTDRGRMYFAKMSSLYSVENKDFDSGVVTP